MWKNVPRLAPARLPSAAPRRSRPDTAEPLTSEAHIPPSYLPFLKPDALKRVRLSPGCQANRKYRKKFGEAVLATMRTLKLDAFVYPAWSNPPAIIGDVRQNLAGDNSQVYSPTTGFPAITVPMGFTRNGRLPAGLTIFGRPWDEGHLFAFAYAYEQATHHRKPPPTTPPLK